MSGFRTPRKVVTDAQTVRYEVRFRDIGGDLKRMDVPEKYSEFEAWQLATSVTGLLYRIESRETCIIRPETDLVLASGGV